MLEPQEQDILEKTRQDLPVEMVQLVISSFVTVIMIVIITISPETWVKYTALGIAIFAGIFFLSATLEHVASRILIHSLKVLSNETLKSFYQDIEDYKEDKGL
jgi:hypothetical protein